MERYLYEESHRNGGRVERIANSIADKMFADFYAEHENRKARHDHNRKWAWAENKSKHRGGSKYLDFDWVTQYRPTRAELNAELNAEISCAELADVQENIQCIIFPDGEPYCVKTNNTDEAEDVLNFCRWEVYYMEFDDGCLRIYCKEVA